MRDDVFKNTKKSKLTQLFSQAEHIHTHPIQQCSGAARSFFIRIRILDPHPDCTVPYSDPDPISLLTTVHKNNFLDTTLQVLITADKQNILNRMNWRLGGSEFACPESNGSEHWFSGFIIYRYIKTNHLQLRGDIGQKLTKENKLHGECSGNTDEMEN